MRIDAEGRWYHQGGLIGRHELVKLFSTILSVDEQGVYWLTTPVERGTIDVEDVPFIAVEMEVRGEDGNGQTIALRTNVDDWVEVDAEHPVWLVHDAQHGPAPYVHVRGGLNARLARAVYYELVALAVEEKSGERTPPEKGTIGIWSKGAFFPLGSVSEPT